MQQLLFQPQIKEMLEQELFKKQLNRVPKMSQVQLRHLLIKDGHLPKLEVLFEEQANRRKGGEGGSTASKG